MKVPEDPKYILGRGESLTRRVAAPLGGAPPKFAYEYDEAVQRLAPQVEVTAGALAELPEEACPEDQGLGIVTLHPQSLARSYHPQDLFDFLGLRQVGSRPAQVVPEAWSSESHPEVGQTTEIFVAGQRVNFRMWSDLLSEGYPEFGDAIRRIESVRIPSPRDKLRLSSASSTSDTERLVLEAVLHSSGLGTAREEEGVGGLPRALEAFRRYVTLVGGHAFTERRLYAGTLCFLPIEIAESSLEDLSKFTFLRVARPMPRLRTVSPIERAVAAPEEPPCPLPNSGPVAPEVRAAIFDGGLRADSPLNRWAIPHDTDGLTKAADLLQDHGHDVTSAALFGPLEPGQEAPQPFVSVDHYRVLDETCDEDPFELYDALRKIQRVLRTRKYQFVNLSVGPSVPVEDDEVHSWTAVLDEFLATGETLCVVAAGNNGGQLGTEARIQVPSDCVNAVTVGSADSVRPGWQRSSYSALGPGRAPGVVKPDVLNFGGSAREPFVVVDSRGGPFIAHAYGTSFAAPATLRLATGLRAHFGDRLTPLGLRALLIHSADAGGQERAHVGWGRVPQELEEFVLCPDGMARIIYQGSIEPTHYIRATIPLPREGLLGMVTLRATFCYATPTDPEDPGNYTRSGLDITFRPDARAFDEGAVDPKPAGFFKRSKYDSEQALRRDAKKWDTVVHGQERKRASSLFQPVFDIHHNAREHGGKPTRPAAIRYALVITVTAPRTKDLYERVVREYSPAIQVLAPVVELPIRT